MKILHELYCSNSPWEILDVTVKGTRYQIRHPLFRHVYEFFYERDTVSGFRRNLQMGVSSAKYYYERVESEIS